MGDKYERICSRFYLRLEIFTFYFRVCFRDQLIHNNSFVMRGFVYYMKDSFL